MMRIRNLGADMGRPYENEMNHLLNTFKWASRVNIDNLQKFIENTQNLKLLAIGSGGSLTTANFLAYIHQKYTGQLSCPSTTMRAMELSQSSDIVTWFLSASGKNSDIKMAFNYMLSREVRQLAVFCCKANSPLAKIASDHPYTNIFEYEPPCGKDGFLATNSLFSSILIIARAYCCIFDGSKYWDEIYEHVYHTLQNSEWWKTLKGNVYCSFEQQVMITLYDTTTMPGAFDLESKFTEAALGIIQLADYRNFAHGRHHWLAQKSQQSSMLAFYSREGKKIAEKTLSLIPESLDPVKIFFDMPSLAATISSVVVAFYLTYWAGLQQAIDPGRPRVPEFGRRLYHMAIPKQRKKNNIGLSEDQKNAIERKSRASIKELEKNGMLSYWVEQYSLFINKLKNSEISSVVLDYDGTVVDSRERFLAPKTSMIKEFERLLFETNILIGFSTGRGDSIRDQLREALEEKYWKRILIGYYNGAELGSLENDIIPDELETRFIDKEMQFIEAKLKELIKSYCVEVKLKSSCFQIGLICKNISSLFILWKLCSELIQRYNLNLKAFYSGHSVDIIPKSTSKLSIIKKIHERNHKGNVLVIGDQGEWPGNDFELLSHPLALSVESVNSDPSTCWNLASSAQIGIKVTQKYLSSLCKKNGKIVFDTELL